jgi:hypothetical protein
MFEFFATVFESLGLTGGVRHPTPTIYVLSFVLGAISADLVVFFMIGSSVGFGKALSLMVVKLASPMGLGVPLLGGVMGTSIFWFPGNRS